MVLSGEPVLGGIGQDTAQHPAQRVARQYVVSDMIGGHFRSCPHYAAGRSAATSVARLAFHPCYPGSPPRSAGVAAAGGNSSQAPATRQIEVEASVARCLRTP